MSDITDVFSTEGESLESFGRAFEMQQPLASKQERLASQTLPIPRPLLRLHDFSLAGERSGRSVIRIVLLENDAVFISSEHTLLQRSLTDVERQPQRNHPSSSSVLQQGVLDVCGLPDSLADGFFALSMQGAVQYFGAKQRVDSQAAAATAFLRTKLFSLPAFFVSSSAPHTQQALMHTQDTDGLLIICTCHMVYVLTYDLRLLIGDGQRSDALVGAVSFPMPLSYASSRQLPAASLLEALPLDEPHHLSVWMPPASGQGSQSALIVCSGSGVFLDTWVVEMKAAAPCGEGEDDPLWELPDSGELDSARVDTPHDCWLTAVSRRPRRFSGRGTAHPPRRREVYATGDGQGHVCFWTLDSVAAGPAFEFKSSRPCTVGDCAITCILLERDDTSLLWVGDESGLATQLCADVDRKRLEILRKINPSSVSPVSELQWRPSDAYQEGRLRVLCLGGGVAFECIVSEAAQSVSSVWPEPPHPPGHRSLVEVCAVVYDLDVVVVAGYGSAAFVYDFAGNRLVCTIASPDRFFTSIAATACTNGGESFVKVLFGHSNGHTHEYRMVPAVGDTTVDAPPVDGAGSTDFARAVSAFDVLSVGESAAATEPPKLQEGGRPGMSGSGFTATYVASTEYCPLPVSDIIMSSLGAHFLVCYARQCIVVHSCASNRALSQLNFDNFLTEVSFVCSTDSPSASEDLLSVALLGPNNIKVFDCIAGAFLTEFELKKFHVNSDIASCAVWESSIADGDGDLRTIKGLYACHGGAIFIFGDEIGCKLMLETRAATTQRQRLAQTSFGSTQQQQDSSGLHISDLVVGVAPYSHGHSPLAAIWFMKKVLLLRMDLTTGFPVATKLFEFNVGDAAAKSRIVAACALRAPYRATSHRVLIITSDGTAITLQL